MCTHRVNFYLQYTIYIYCIWLVQVKNIILFALITVGHKAISQVVICEMCPSISFPIKGSIVCQSMIHSFNWIIGKESSQWKCLKCSHVYLASWILECEKLKWNPKFVRFLCCTGLTGNMQIPPLLDKLPSEKSCKAMVNSAVRNTQRS